MLAGHLPYWVPERVATHPDELLRARLANADASKSLAEQDLISLADGLEGRSTNPVSLLVSFRRTKRPHSATDIHISCPPEQLDNLQNPCADLGMDVPSMLRYKYHPEKEVSSSIHAANAIEFINHVTVHKLDNRCADSRLSLFSILPTH